MTNHESNIVSISYYPPEKTYAPVRPILHNPGEPFELVQFQQNAGLTVEFSAAEVRRPVFYVCRNRGILRFNRAVYSLVTIPAQLRPIIARSSEIEIVITSAGSASVVSVCAPVERVLRFPEYLRSLESEARQEKEEAAEKKSESPSADEMIKALNGEEKLKADTPAATGKKRTPPRPIFETWLDAHGGEILEEYPGCESDHVLATLGGSLLLVSFFDDTESDWLADEHEFPEPPKWSSGSLFRQSPLYAVGRAARNFSQQHQCEILPIAILSDHINIVNADSMADVWQKTGVEIFYCSRSENFAMPFAEYLLLLSAFPDPGPSLDELDEIKAAIGDQLASFGKKES